MIRWDINEFHFQTVSINYLPFKMSRYFFFDMGLLGMFWDLAEIFYSFVVPNEEEFGC